MIATHATKNRVRYRYYVSQPSMRGAAKCSPGSVTRVPATEIEAVVSEALVKHLAQQTPATKERIQFDHSIVAAHVARIEVRPSELMLHIKSTNPDAIDNDERDSAGSEAEHDQGDILLIPWVKPPSRKAREILLPASGLRHDKRPIKAVRKTALIRSIARGRQWLDDIVSGRAANFAEIAARHKCGIRHVNLTISMAFLAPALVKAAVQGRLPRGVGVASLRDAPAEWSQQFKRLGLTPVD